MIEKLQQNSFCTCLQLFHLICLLLFYGHVYQKIWRLELQIENKKLLLTTIQRVKRSPKAGLETAVNDELSQWTVLLGHDSIIPVKDSL